MSDASELTWSSGNVFADLGLDDPDLLMTKAEIAIAITKVIRERGLTQASAADELGCDQAKVSALMRGRLDAFSLKRLTVWARRLGIDVRVSLAPTADPAGRGHMIVDHLERPFAAATAPSQKVAFD